VSLPAAFLDELKRRTDLRALVGRTVRLVRAGRDAKGCCPFHQEKTPSFHVFDDHYHCFGCGAHGSAIDWLIETQGLDFPEAVRALAAQAGMEVPAPTPQARAAARRSATLAEAVAAAQEWFAAQLWGPVGAQARALLERRGVMAATARAFGLGYAPDSRQALRQALGRFGDALLAEAGLLVQPEGEGAPYDRFRGRLIFPIRDARGRTVGFGGRALGDGQPKYLNSPDTPLFDKGRTLWNLDRAVPAARTAGRLVVVEGYMDAIALAQAGVGEVVAPLGTALTGEQLALAWRLAGAPLVCFDGDRAGARAALRAAERALTQLAPGRSLRIVTLPEGQDPDDLVRAGGRAAFESVAERAEPLDAALWRMALAEADTSTPEGRAGLRARLMGWAGQVADREVRRQYERAFAERFWDMFGWKKGAAGAPGARAAAVPRLMPPIVARQVRAALAGLLVFPEVAAADLDAVAALPAVGAAEAALRDALAEALWAEPDLGPGALRARLEAQGHGAALAAVGAAAPPIPAEADEARADLARLVAALAALAANRRERQEARRALAALLDRDESETGPLQQRLDALTERVRALLAARQRLMGELLDREQARHAGSARHGSG
jgi:DNA primase